MKQKEVDELIKKGYLPVRAIIEIVGRPEEYVKEAMTKQLETIEKNFLIVTKEILETEKKEDFFSTFSEIELLFEKPKDLMAFCFDHLPSSIELLEQDNIHFSQMELTDFLNDMLTKMHVLNSGIQGIRSRNTFYIKNTAVLLRNFIVVLLSGKPLTSKQLIRYMGIKEKEVVEVLNVLIKEGKVKKKKDLYQIIPGS